MKVTGLYYKLYNERAIVALFSPICTTIYLLVEILGYLAFIKEYLQAELSIYLRKNA
ncbi:hypothetical protein NUACC21_27150 [Scytonema sp. NUACC21]